MEIKQLEYFRAIVDAGTISGAARNLHMTQPPLSYQIKMLEEELGVKLFVRGAKNITLTEAGKALYIRAGSLLTMADITTLRTPISVNGYASHILMTDELCAMSVLQEKWGENGVLTLEQLSGEPLILSHRYRGFLLSAFERKGLSVDIYYECEDARTAMTLAENGLGIAILPASMRPLADKCFVYKIDSDELITEVLLAWNKEKVTDEIKEFLEFLFNQFD